MVLANFEHKSVVGAYYWLPFFVPTFYSSLSAIHPIAGFYQGYRNLVLVRDTNDSFVDVYLVYLSLLALPYLTCFVFFLLPLRTTILHFKNETHERISNSTTTNYCKS